MKTKLLLSIFLLLTSSSLRVSISEAAGVFSYITNQKDGTVSIIDTSTRQVEPQTIEVGKDPIGVAVSPDGKKVYITNSGSNTVSVIDATTRTVKASIPVGEGPEGIAITPDGKKVYVSNFKSNTVSVIETSTDTVKPSPIVNGIGTGPQGIVIAPDGKKAYVANFDSSNVSIIDTLTDTADVNLIPVIGRNPQGIAITPNGEKIYVANSGSNNIAVIGTKEKDVIKPLISVGSIPWGVVVTPDGKKVYVTNTNSNNVLVIDIATDQINPNSIFVGTHPQGISITPDGKKIHVANTGSDADPSKKISEIDTSTDQVNPDPISVGNFPTSFGSFITPFAITSPLTASVNVGSPFNYTFTAISARPITSYTAESLPAGLSFNPNSGILSGTPTTEGVFKINLGVKNDQVELNELLTLTVVKPGASTSSQNGGGCSLGSGSSINFMQMFGGIILILSWFRMRFRNKN